MYVSGLYNYQLKSTSDLVLQNVKLKIYKCYNFVDNKRDDVRIE